jgi:hypothetical protein
MKDRVDFDIWHRKLSLFIDLIIYLTVFNAFKGEEKGVLGVRSTSEK